MIGWISPPDPSSTVGSSSSFQLDDGGIFNDLDGHFEEIGLDDEDIKEYNRLTSQKQPPRGPTMSRPLSSMGPQSQNSLGSRDLTSGRRPAHKSLQPQVHTPQADHLVPYTPSSRRAVSTTGLNRISLTNRSPSPSPLNPVPPVSPGRPTTSNGPGMAPGRRSWQATRKTVEELENECDSDDDIPADTIFYNVPVSPRSARALSATPSPDRTTMLESPLGGRPGNAGPTPSAIRPPTLRGSTSNIPIAGEPAHGDSIRGRTQYRAKSWSDAMSELGTEAKELSEALEAYAEIESEKTEKRLALGKAEPQHKNASPTKAAPVDLPPIQMQNGMIDPLPISKEKAEVLSRTRPSWLPPKSKEEEKRHLKEYQKMMRLSQEAERKRVEKERAEQAEKDRMKTDTHKLWNQHIIPNWDTMVRTEETRELWWRGVAPRCRGKVWNLAFGNHLTVGPETFKLALKRARDVEQGVKKSPTMYSFKERELFDSIRKDVNKTFPELKIFQENGPLHESLLEVLQAYSMYRSDVGYVYGTHTVAGLLLLNQSPPETFTTLVNLLNRPLPLAFYTQDYGAMSRVYSLFLKAFKYKLPSLHAHITATLKLQPAQYLEAMFLTLFSLHCPLDIVCRIWDVYGFEGDAFLVRCAIGVLTVLESKLYGSAEEVVRLLGWQGAKVKWDVGNEDSFMGAVRAAGRETKEDEVGPNW
ncbi:hypothetical protein DFP73DRAFT_592350 [Morchella snyderi]|nr:hypothetical protein DFP73DRAFT_592350 [Morchella snyderi]